jgi:hypothetical protein
MDYEEIFQQYIKTSEWEDGDQAYKEQLRLIKLITTKFPKDRPHLLVWFIAALRDKNKNWFAAKILEKVSPFPSSLFTDTMMAALVEKNPSAIRLYLYPCVRQFGVEAVKSEMVNLSTVPEVVQNDGVSKAMYALEFCNV